jgi:phosphoenolpyruvate carboxylase
MEGSNGSHFRGEPNRKWRDQWFERPWFLNLILLFNEVVKSQLSLTTSIVASVSENKVSCAAYRHTVRDDPRFVPYFRQATPELELGRLNIGSRPSKRNPKGGVER